MSKRTCSGCSRILEAKDMTFRAKVYDHCPDTVFIWARCRHCGERYLLAQDIGTCLLGFKAEREIERLIELNKEKEAAGS